MTELYEGCEQLVFNKQGRPQTANILGQLRGHSSDEGKAARQAQQKIYNDNAKAAKRTPPKQTPKNRPREPSDKDEDDDEPEEEKEPD